MLGPLLLLHQKSTSIVLDFHKLSAVRLRLAKQCDTIITMLPSSPHVREVYLGSTDAIIHGLRPTTLCIDSSTIDPDTSRLVAAEIAKQDCIMVDAPVSVQ
jgi:3-hydroxyisobutyrate dehydrogenase-like beta-hydroxyacid dehydrogenase